MRNKKVKEKINKLCEELCFEGEYDLAFKIREMLKTSEDTSGSPDEELVEVPTPVGDFVLNFKCENPSLTGSDGTYYHYADVCRMLESYDIRRI